MLFADAVLTAVEGAGAKLLPVGPPNRYEEIAGHPNVTLMACKPCVDTRGISASASDPRQSHDKNDLGQSQQFRDDAVSAGEKCGGERDKVAGDVRRKQTLQAKKARCVDETAVKT